MKKILLLLNFTHLAFGQGIVEFKTGTSFGFCLGYCLSDLTITANNVDYILYGWDENDPVFRPVAISDTVDSNDWEDLNTHFNFEIFMSLDSIIGCPDCADGGAEWFEIVTIDTTRRVTIEFGDSLDGLNNYIDLLRSVRHSFQEIQACHYIPNAGICLAAIPKYYYDQEENQCMEFTWGGCGGLVPFETLEDCESNCINDGLELSNDIFQYPAKYNLNNCYPNPFNPTANLRFFLPQSGRVSLRVFDLTGRVVRTLVAESAGRGFRTVVWNGRDQNGLPVASGLYLVELRAAHFHQVRKLMLLK